MTFDIRRAQSDQLVEGFDRSLDIAPGPGLASNLLPILAGPKPARRVFRLGVVKVEHQLAAEHFFALAVGKHDQPPPVALESGRSQAFAQLGLGQGAGSGALAHEGIGEVAVPGLPELVKVDFSQAGTGQLVRQTGGGDADFKDVYIGLDDIPFLGEIKVGHFKEPFSLNELTSSGDDEIE